MTLIKMCLNETYIKVRVDKDVSDTFPIQSVLRQGDNFSLLIFNFIFEYGIRKVQENQERLELNGTHQLLIYADDIHTLYENIRTINEKNESLISG
jgi:hypothetical protein